MATTRALRYVCVVFLALLARAPVLHAQPQPTDDDINFRKEVFVGKAINDRLPYRLFVPTGYDANRKYPFILWLHGGRGGGSDNVRQLGNQNQLGTHFWISESVQSKFPVFVMAPQCPAGKIWADPEFNIPSECLKLTVSALLKVEKDFSIDPDRIYIGGQSMGGSGVWSVLQNYPEIWAAAIVMSAYDNFTEPAAIARIPLWVFQGAADASVPVRTVRTMMDQLRKLHANLRYTEYPKTDHEVWNKAFAEPDLVDWLSSQKRPSLDAPPASQLGSGTPHGSR